MPWPTDRTHEPISLLIAAPETNRLYSALVGDARFQVQALARSPEEVSEKLALQPQALLVEGTLYPSPEELNRALAGVNCPVVVLLPAHVPKEGMERVQRLPQVVAVASGESDLPALADRLVEGVQNRQGAHPNPKTTTVLPAPWPLLAGAVWRSGIWPGAWASPRSPPPWPWKQPNAVCPPCSSV